MAAHLHLDNYLYLFRLSNNSKTKLQNICDNWWATLLPFSSNGNMIFYKILSAPWKTFNGVTSSRWPTPQDCGGTPWNWRKKTRCFRPKGTMYAYRQSYRFNSPSWAFKNQLEAYLERLPRKSQENQQKLVLLLLSPYSLAFYFYWPRRGFECNCVDQDV